MLKRFFLPIFLLVASAASASTANIFEGLLSQETIRANYEQLSPEAQAEVEGTCVSMARLLEDASQEEPARTKALSDSIDKLNHVLGLHLVLNIVQTDENGQKLATITLENQ